jgi:UDP-2,3-diacylglucosamine pyrophosphatase LpxH
MLEKKILSRLTKLFMESPVVTISKNTKLVVFSDLHMGNGKPADDFLKNGKCFTHLLANYYLPNNFTLILNGDIEELHRFHLKQIVHQWQEIYQLFGNFNKRNNLIKLIGNHDYELKIRKIEKIKLPWQESVRLHYENNYIFIFHGHQANWFNQFFNTFTGFLLRALANPLGIKNYSIAYNSKKRYAIEKRVYNFSRMNKIISLIGHTHRPLFESLSKIDRIKYSLERQCRLYPKASEKEKENLKKDIKKNKQELEKLIERGNDYKGNLYASEPLVPCIFNSGCAIDENGITCIEISKANIQLVYWFDKKRTKTYLDYQDHTPEPLKNCDYYRVVLKKEPLDYIFTRISLLA